MVGPLLTDAIPRLRGERLVGLLTQSGLGRFVEIRHALAQG